MYTYHIISFLLFHPTKLSLPKCHFSCRYQICHYQIVGTKLSLL